MHFWGWIWPATLLWVILFYLRFKFFPRNGHPGWPIYKEKYTSLSFRCTTKRNIVVHTYAGCCQCQSHQFGWWQFSITKNWVWNVDPWHGQQVDPQRLITEKTGLICSTPLVTQQKSQLWNIPGAFKKYGKKVQITSGKFWTLAGKTLIMENTETGELLSQTFFP